VANVTKFRLSLSTSKSYRPQHYSPA